MSGGRVNPGKKLRFEVFKRDGFSCQYCGATPPGALLEVDHIHPVASGGETLIDNLITACRDCNSGKGARLLSSAPKTIKEKESIIRERERQLAEYNALICEIRDRKEKEAWEIASAIEGKNVDSYIKQDIASIKMFLDRLPFEDVLQAADYANGRIDNKDSRFKYFCGVCWAVIRSGWKS